MRIVGEIEHPNLKITIFHHENKYSVQVEDGQVSQNYKFREDTTLSSVEIVKELFKAELEKISKTNMEMQSVMSSIADHIAAKDELPKII